MSPADPIAAIATAPGRGAVGIVRVSGKRLAALVERVCGRALAPRAATYLRFQDAAGQPIDHGLALFFPAPHSYTGEDVLELQGHGGPLVLQLLLARVLEAGGQRDPATDAPCVPGLRLAQPGEFTQRAFLNGKIDLAQAESIADLIDASTEAAARSAARSLSGAFSAETERLLDALVRLRLLVEATLDFPEEEIDFLEQSDARGQLAQLQQSVRTVLAAARQGALLQGGVKIVIAGQPNAGKSSLLNALAGAELAIVTPVPGTTRDTIHSTIQIEGVPIHVIDTAGLRESSDEVEKIGIARAWEQIGAADAVLFVHDLSRLDAIDYVAEDARLASALAQKLPQHVPILPVWNKLDAAVGKPPDAGLALSARTGAGLAELRRALLEIAGWQSLPEGVFIARERHVQALTRVDARLQNAAACLDHGASQLEFVAEELRLAQQSLSEITGAFTSDDLLGEIFSRFCIGK